MSHVGNLRKGVASRGNSKCEGLEVETHQGCLRGLLMRAGPCTLRENPLPSFLEESPLSPLNQHGPRALGPPGSRSGCGVCFWPITT